MKPIIAASIGKKILVTTDNWFLAPDGKEYRAVFGTLNSIQNAQEVLGIKVNARSQDWYISIGNIAIAGCQIHYVIQTEKVSSESAVGAWTSSAEVGCKEFLRPNAIYFSDEVSA